MMWACRICGCYHIQNKGGMVRLGGRVVVVKAVWSQTDLGKILTTPFYHNLFTYDPVYVFKTLDLLPHL